MYSEDKYDNLMAVKHFSLIESEADLVKLYIPYTLKYIKLFTQVCTDPPYCVTAY